MTFDESRAIERRDSRPAPHGTFKNVLGGIGWFGFLICVLALILWTPAFGLRGHGRGSKLQCPRSKNRVPSFEWMKRGGREDDFAKVRLAA